MENLGGLDDMDKVVEEEKNPVSFEEHKSRRKPFHYWEVDGVTHKMKLTTGMIEKLENKYRRNLLNVVSDDGIPPLSVMLTVAQASIVPWEHGVKYQDVQRLYDLWVEKDGGSQMDFLSKVLIPTMAVSGFFTPEQAESILAQMQEATNLI